VIEKIIELLLRLFGGIQRERDKNIADEQRNEALKEADELSKDSSLSDRIDRLNRLRGSASSKDDS
jgi:hypothetical protein